MNAAIQKGLSDWHRFVETVDVDLLKDLAHPDALLHSPSGHNPYTGYVALSTALPMVMSIFENFRYHREFINEDEMSVVLEFSAQIDGRDLKGVDLIRFDETGKLTELEVAIRPVALAARLAELMAEKTGHVMPGVKVKAS
ncbi:hypothetical protein RUESEDTHA_04152 [Ruegeria sp. THAF57]|uniref:nuclear transport factor 2 family protein n=1 Tax=Ruegeria sp. THAF57 TaxID=2744555 RepID=UPI0015E03B0B|nr:nuclear transport factor 2 family protein [Ruegeria sp. THAF57]CAD0187240.1 hypothetical protein RUESEDTHA_04152 [Ruegeria sp. THAF57]